MENLDKLINGPNMTKEMSYQTARQSRDSLSEEVEEMASWIQDPKRVDRREVQEIEDKLIANEILGSHVMRKELNGGPIW